VSDSELEIEDNQKKLVELVGRKRKSSSEVQSPQQKKVKSPHSFDKSIHSVEKKSRGRKERISSTDEVSSSHEDLVNEMVVKTAHKRSSTSGTNKPQSLQKLTAKKSTRNKKKQSKNSVKSKKQVKKPARKGSSKKKRLTSKDPSVHNSSQEEFMPDGGDHDEWPDEDELLTITARAKQLENLMATSMKQQVTPTTVTKRRHKARNSK